MRSSPIASAQTQRTRRRVRCPKTELGAHLVRSPMAAITSSGNRRSSSTAPAAAVSSPPLGFLCLAAALALRRVRQRGGFSADKCRVAATRATRKDGRGESLRTGSAGWPRLSAAAAPWSSPGGGERLLCGEHTRVDDEARQSARCSSGEQATRTATAVTSSGASSSEELMLGRKLSFSEKKEWLPRSR